MTNPADENNDAHFASASAPHEESTFDAATAAKAGAENSTWPDKYKPQRIEDLILPEGVHDMLRAWSQPAADIPHVLIVGQSGTGKTTALDLVIQASGLSPFKINGALDRGIDVVREIREAIRTLTVFSERRAVFIDELDGLTPEAFSGLRGDTIAGSSSTAVFVATCNHLERIPEAIRNRFHIIHLDDEIARCREELELKHQERAFAILRQEGIEFDRSEVERIVKEMFPSARKWMLELQARAAAGEIRSSDVISIEPDQDPPSAKAVSVPADQPASEPIEPTPAPARTDAADILDDIERHLTRFISTTDANLRAIALFVLHAHAHEAASHSPLLWLNSPEKRCGKTTALKMVSHLVPNPIITSNISVAGMLKAIQNIRPTFLIDEMEHALKATGGLHGVLNLGHAPDGVIVRNDATYSTWSPKVVALIGELPGTLADRSVRIALRRRLATEVVERFTRKDEPEAEALRVRCEAWATEVVLANLTDMDPDVPLQLSDRAQDNWRPLIAIADLAGGDWPDKAREAAKVISAHEDIEEPSAGILILSAARDWFAGKDDAHIASATLADLAANAGAVGGKPTSRMIRCARILSGLGVPRHTFRPPAGEPRKGFKRADMEDAFTRYLPEEADVG